jgi:hypothetical protein
MTGRLAVIVVVLFGLALGACGGSSQTPTAEYDVVA